MTTWGAFGVAHLLSLLGSVLIIIGLYYLLKNRSKETIRIVLFVLSLSGIGAILYNLLAWGSLIEYLPLHISAPSTPFSFPSPSPPRAACWGICC